MHVAVTCSWRPARPVRPELAVVRHVSWGNTSTLRSEEKSYLNVSRVSA